MFWTNNIVGLLLFYDSQLSYHNLRQTLSRAKTLLLKPLNANLLFWEMDLYRKKICWTLKIMVYEYMCLGFSKF